MDYTPFRGSGSSPFHLWFPFPATRPIRSRHLITWSPGTGGYPKDVCYFTGGDRVQTRRKQNRSGGNFEGVKTGSRWALEALLDGFRTPDHAQRGPRGGPRGAQTGPQKRAKKIKKPRGSKGRARNLQKWVPLKKGLQTCTGSTC